MALLECKLGAFRSSTALPQLYSLDGLPIENYLRAAARSSDGNALIELNLNLDALSSPFAQSATEPPTSGWYLQKALEEVTRLDWSEPGLRDRVGLIMADSWEGSATTFGMMFDVGFYVTDLNSAGIYNYVAREGCAVFVDAIRDVREGEGFSDEEIHRQIMWTILHELGHVFNLWHIDAPVRFLTSSREEEIFTPTGDGTIEYAYHHAHSEFLESCLSDGLEDPKAVFAWPGGSMFGSRYQHGSTDPDFYRSFDAPSSRSALELRLVMHQREFWNFDPVELDIEVRVPGDIKKRYYLPDKIDPGYSSFNIWIEEPDGCRRRYRSPRIYCENPGTVRIEAGAPFRRDLSIFGESGGYTFRKAGPHRLFATWILPGDRVLESNRVKINVKPWLSRGPEFRARKEVLTEANVAQLLYHREGRFQNRIVEAVETLAARTDDRRLEANLHYAVGRYLYQAGKGRSRSTRKRHHSRGINHLCRALEMEDVLSPRREYHAARLEDQIRQD